MDLTLTALDRFTFAKTMDMYIDASLEDCIHALWRLNHKPIGLFNTLNYKVEIYNDWTTLYNFEIRMKRSHRGMRHNRIFARGVLQEDGQKTRLQAKVRFAWMAYINILIMPLVLIGVIQFYPDYVGDWILIVAVTLTTGFMWWQLLYDRRILIEKIDHVLSKI
jgi:hypothetical protein